MMREGVRGGQGPRRWWIVREIKEILRLVRLEEEGSVVLAEGEEEEDDGAWCEWSKQCVVVGTTAGRSLASRRIEWIVLIASGA